MEKSSGIVIIKNNKILLCHPTNAPWINSFSIPKGKIEKGEEIIDAAIRETFEETGLFINKDKLIDGDVIVYKNKKNKTYKQVYYFVYYDNDNMIPDVIPTEKLQLREVDYASFLTYDEAINKIFWRFIPILELLKDD